MGAPKGNRNALKHGLYAKHYTAEELARLRKMTPDNYEPELGMIRMVVNNVFEIHVYIQEVDGRGDAEPASRWRWRRWPNHQQPEPGADGAEYDGAHAGAVQRDGYFVER